MNFWKVLRWAATCTFVALLLASQIGVEVPTSGGVTVIPARTVPSFNR